MVPAGSHARRRIGDSNGTIPLVGASQTGLVHEGVWRAGLPMPSWRSRMTPPICSLMLLFQTMSADSGFGNGDFSTKTASSSPSARMTDAQAADLHGTGRRVLERFHLPSANASFVEIKIASQALASQQYVESEIAAHDADLNAHGMLARKSVEIIAGTGLSRAARCPVTLHSREARREDHAGRCGRRDHRERCGDWWGSRDLASARGQVGPARELGSNVDYNTVTEAGFYFNKRNRRREWPNRWKCCLPASFYGKKKHSQRI